MKRKKGTRWPQAFCLKISLEDVEWLERIANERGISKSDVCRWALAFAQGRTAKSPGGS